MLQPRVRRMVQNDAVLHFVMPLILIAAALLGGLQAAPALAQDGGSPPRPAQPSGLARQDASGNWLMHGTASVDAAALDAPDMLEGPAATGGPDDYGYTYNDTAPFSWIEASGGTDTGMSGYSDDQRVGPIALPFSFKYYENSYSTIYIAASGYVAFQDSTYWPTQVETPDPELPNTIISPYSTPIDLAAKGTAGRVFYQAGGTAPNRYFVVAWNEVTYKNMDDRHTFEVVLHENGDIVFQYKTMIYGPDDAYYCGYAGIENAEGLIGLQYTACDQIAANKAIRFTRPQPTARVSLSPRGQGAFTHAGTSESFRVTLFNNGELGADTYKLSLASPWAAQLLRRDGSLLTDTDGDGAIDSGPVGQGQRMQVVVRVQTPVVAAVADYNNAILVVQSTRNKGWQRQTLLRSAVPAPFAQVYRDIARDGVRVNLADPQNNRVSAVSSFPYAGETAISALPGGGHLVVWSQWADVNDRINYVILDKNGAVTGGIRSLQQAGGGWLEGYVSSLAAATTPDGVTGIVWTQVESRFTNGDWEDRYNTFWAAVDKAGNQVLAPTNLTGNNQFAAFGVQGYVSIYQPGIAATADNRFMIAWESDRASGNRWMFDVFYTVRNAANSAIKGVTQLSATSALGLNRAEYPVLAAMADGRVVVSYRTSSSAVGISTVQMTSAGDLIGGPSSSGSGIVVPQAITQLSNGSVLLVWTRWAGPSYRLYYAVLNGSTLATVAGPTWLDNPASLTGDVNASAAATAGGQAIISWGELNFNYRRAQFYALVDQSGAVLTPATTFIMARTPANGELPRIQSSPYGYGIAVNRLFDPSSTTLPDVAVTAPSLGSGAPGTGAQVQIGVSNRGLAPAGSVVVTAQLDSQLTYAWARPAPVSVEMAASAEGAAVPTILRWELPSLAYLSQGRIVLGTSVPTATIGSTFPVTITVTHAGADFDDGNMTVRSEVMAAEQLFAPIVANDNE